MRMAERKRSEAKQETEKQKAEQAADASQRKQI